MDQQSYRRIISGQSKGLCAGFLRFLLLFASFFYSIIVRIRNFLYSAGLLKTHRVEAVVISIGNITAGGTGKTPLVVWLCKEIAKNTKLKCAILTRGYGSKENSDEPALLAQNCPDVGVIVDPDRVAGASEAIERHKAQILIMDDGFQHRRLYRDFDIVTIDATCPLGYDKVLPAGLLRESVTGLKRASAFVITRSNQVGAADIAKIEQQLHLHSPDAPIAQTTHAPTHVGLTDNKTLDIEALKGKRIFSFSGIGNPDSFLKTISQLGSEIVGSKAFDDHFQYTEVCLSELSRQARNLNTDFLLTTQKDWTKIQALLPTENKPLFAYLAIEIKFINGLNTLTNLIQRTIEGKI